MLRLILLSFVVVLIGALASVAQSYPGAANCFDPLPQKVDEFVFTRPAMKSSSNERRNSSRRSRLQVVPPLVG